MINTVQTVSTQAHSIQKVAFTAQQNSQKKKLYPAIASVVLPGSGQMLNGEVKKGLVLLGAQTALGAVVGKLGQQIYKTASSVKTNPKAVLTQAQKTALNTKGAGLLAAALAATGIVVYSAVNAYKHSADDKASGKNTLSSVASYFVPGSGQMMNGEVKKGLGLLASAIGLMLINARNGLKLNFPAIRIGTLVSTALSLYSAVDAYRHNKTEK